MNEPRPDSPSVADHSLPKPAVSAEEAIVGGALEPSDDTPTIISRAAPRTAGAEELFGGGLRGRRLAHFELIEAIGVGGMAAVLRARDTQLDRYVALKILPPDMAVDAENIRRFHQEARAAAKLDHENIARVFFCGEDQKLHFIAFEFVEGENLRALLERRVRLPVGESVHYMLQVAAGLAHAARRGVVHRDIKPSNIIITPNGRAKLVDMGLARSLEPHAEDGLTQSGVTLGTFDYISPEQALEPRDADVRSDIYSLGCTFYHMLTGQPPVPEGTAAKKLHFHQHVKPPDPRQFVPDLPDEVAVILDRMMAKLPKDRYQSPEELVHHLLMTARKLGSAPEVPEGVLSVEAALPNGPRSRPFLLIALACAAVVGLIFLIDHASSPSRRPAEKVAIQLPDPPEGRDKSAAGQPADGTAPPGLPPETQPRPPEPLAPVVFEEDRPTAASLAAWLDKHRDAEELVIVLRGNLDLSAVEGGQAQDLLIRNKRLTLRSRPGLRPTIRYVYDGQPAAGSTRAPLTIDSQHSVIEGIHFIIDARGATTPLAALVYRKGAEHHVQGCTFLQAQPPEGDRNRLASVVIETTEAHPRVAVDQCVFVGAGNLELQSTPRGDEWKPSPGLLGGQNAITRHGPARLEVTNCAFGPHEAIFRLENAGPDDETSVVVRHCSVQAAGQSAVFDLADGARARLEVSGSLFSRPSEGVLGAMGEGKGALLLRQSARTGEVVYQGKDNRYHNLDGYWYTAELGIEPNWEDWHQRTMEKDDCRELRTSPWRSAEPLKLLEQLKIEEAFRVDGRLAELRLNDGKDLAGVEVLGTISYLNDLPNPGTSSPAPMTRTLVVDADPLKADTTNGIYPTLDQALAVVRPADVVLIRHNSELKLDPVALSKKELGDVTIRPHPGYHPVLTLKDTAAGERDTALFRVYDGQLKLEGLEFRLRPGRDEVDAQALVAMAGDGQCALKGCVLTLDRAGHSASLALATLPERGKVMPSMEMTPARSREQGPRLRLEHCFVRGEGELLWARASRPAELDVKNSVIALTGSLLNIEAAHEAVSDKGAMVARLNRVTTYLQGNLLRVRAGKDLKGLTRIECRPADCLFLAPGPPAVDRILVHLEGPEGEETALRAKLTWGEEGVQNAYGGFSCLLDQQTPEEGKMPLFKEQWRSFSNESSSEFGARLALPVAADVVFTQLVPAQFKPADDMPARYGVTDPLTLPWPRGTAPGRAPLSGD
jgi:serine/threonine protein kinase